jgi:hypothetical protein
LEEKFRYLAAGIVRMAVEAFFAEFSHNFKTLPKNSFCGKKFWKINSD